MINFLRQEIEAFRILTPQARVLLFCSQLLNLAGPFIGVFLNLYLWNSTNDFYVVILFNLLFYVSIPFGFVANALLLKRVKLNILYSLGFISHMVIPLIIIVLHQNLSGIIAPLGLINGFGAAFYWANKNYLDFSLNTEEKRHYFVGLDSSLAALSSITVPVFVGFVIDKTGSYYFSFLIASIILAFSAFIANKYIEIKEVIPFKLSEYKIVFRDPNWLKARILFLLHGILTGLLLLTSSVLAFQFTNKAFGVGLFNSLGGLAGIIGGYLAARYVKPDKRLPISIVATIIIVAGDLIFGLWPVTAGFILFVIAVQIGGYITWNVAYGLNMRAIDRGATNPQGKVHYVIDNEIFINIGRVIGVGIFVLLLNNFSLLDSFRWAIIISAMVNVANLWAIKFANG